MWGSTSTVAEEAAAQPPVDNDLEDGEIEDDGEDEMPVEAAPKESEPTPQKEKPEQRPVDRTRHERPERRRHEDKKKHMTEAEKSILHLRKRERMQREKWEKYRKEQNLEPPVVDDFAINIEKAIASVLKKDSKHVSDEEKEEEKRGRKRKNRDKDRPKGIKQRKMDSPKSEDIDENEFLNIGLSPVRRLVRLRILVGSEQGR
ncbi:hypothetical protein GEV33_007954 [Tenebrio molitor]|uniref:Uncharacterized protein n=1 Tax=Tenebrio molitor TaxID=7067 RepID=A0A8J6LBV0_TENMO|nr:hypothetical protein GEV33_007954 [Tenebrio molitor]